MATMTRTKAKTELTSRIADKLGQSFRRSGSLAQKARAAFRLASEEIVEALVSDRKAVAALTVLLDARVTVVEADPWLKTEEAATKMGFSRPYVAALIDAGEFGTGASKTVKGHRRVKASAVEKWLRDHEVSSERRALAASSDGMAEFFDVPTLPSEDSAKLEARIRKARDDSLSHRPPPKRA